MIALAQSDVLKALKHCICLTKQDFVFSTGLQNSAYWQAYAAARYHVYLWLQTQISKYGVNQAYLLAVKRYDGLPLFIATTEQKGEREALEAFFIFTSGQTPVKKRIDA